ncbi:MAG: ABC transporter ATP-binding protein [Chloroflexaceae bacterium]|nr:ABC transporter ATP-binding protein [Chloroflexaceae bacterium]
MRVSSASASVIRLHNISKHYGGEVQAVNKLSLDVPRGTLLALLGPSGCGKSTTLRLIAGLETPDSGDIWLDERHVTGRGVQVPPEARRVGMVFQDYALFPHLTIADNIAFPLNHLPATQRRQRVAAMLELVGLQGRERRYPHELSGGQQQRVALARALAADPAVVLLDEPFSNLDAALRRQTREEVRAILKTAGTTTVFVTHDQEEALSIADLVAVMAGGYLLQVGLPRKVYLEPASLEVATFVGEANIIPGEAHGDTVTCTLGHLPLLRAMRGPVQVLVRYEALQLAPDPQGGACIEQVTFYGAYQQASVRYDDGTRVQARALPLQLLTPGDRVRLTVAGTVLAYPPGQG